MKIKEFVVEQNLINWICPYCKRYNTHSPDDHISSEFTCHTCGTVSKLEQRNE